MLKFKLCHNFRFNSIQEGLNGMFYFFEGEFDRKFRHYILLRQSPDIPNDP